MIFEQSGTFPLDWISSSVINALFIGGLTWGGDLYIYIREESRGVEGRRRSILPVQCCSKDGY